MSMDRVYRYPLDLVAGPQEIPMPEGAEVLSAGFQRGREVLQLWAVVDPEKDPETRLFVIYGTGHEFLESYEDGELEHVSTFTLPANSQPDFVWHVFEVHDE